MNDLYHFVIVFSDKLICLYTIKLCEHKIKNDHQLVVHVQSNQVHSNEPHYNHQYYIHINLPHRK